MSRAAVKHCTSRSLHKRGCCSRGLSEPMPPLSGMTGRRAERGNFMARRTAAHGAARGEGPNGCQHNYRASHTFESNTVTQAQWPCCHLIFTVIWHPGYQCRIELQEDIAHGHVPARLSNFCQPTQCQPQSHPGSPAPPHAQHGPGPGLEP